tara:strand:- start:88681 stop:89355 length:675 start_codon:yes stop_codon:yes gene_type:complete
MSRLLTLTLLVTISLVTAARAQWNDSYAGYYGYGNYGYGWGTATTPQEAAYRGFAEALRARAEAQRAAADATLKYEEARSKYIDNQRKWADTYSSLERSRIGAKNLEKERRREELQRRLEIRRKLAARSRLSPAEFDPATGFIKWPDAIMTRPYVDDRQRLEELLVLQRYSRGRPEIAVETDKVVLKLQATLDRQFKSLHPSQWATANRFLRSLRSEVARLFRR